MSTLTTNDRIVTIRCRAFSGGRIKEQRCMVDADGSIRVWDEVAGYYTTCHSMSQQAQAHARKLARK